MYLFIVLYITFYTHISNTHTRTLFSIDINSKSFNKIKKNKMKTECVTLSFPFPSEIHILVIFGLSPEKHNQFANAHHESAKVPTRCPPFLLTIDFYFITYRKRPRM